MRAALSEHGRKALGLLAIRLRATAFEIGGAVLPNSDLARERSNIGKGIAYSLVQRGLADRNFDAGLNCYFYTINAVGRDALFEHEPGGVGQIAHDALRARK